MFQKRQETEPRNWKWNVSGANTRLAILKKTCEPISIFARFSAASHSFPATSHREHSRVIGIQPLSLARYLGQAVRKAGL